MDTMNYANVYCERAPRLPKLRHWSKTIAFLLPLVIGCHQKVIETKGKFSGMHSDGKEKVQVLVDEIERCPAWSRHTSNDLVVRQAILNHLRTISQAESDDIRSAIELFIAAREKAGSYGVDEMSKLFVLNRYLFDVPVSADPEGAKYFGGWVGVPCDKNHVDLLWPLSLNDKGDLVLKNGFRGYLGDDYVAMDEFDWFTKKYGRRKGQIQ